MGADSSVQRDGKSQEEDASASASASAGELSAELHALHSKPLEKNGQISSMTSVNGHSEDNTLAEVGQPDGVAQKEEAPETMDTIQGEVAPQVNGEKVEKESPDANDISAIEEKAAEEKPEDANEVGFKKIFRFVGFKFTLKKDKSEEKDPVKLLTVKDKEEEGQEVGVTDEPTKEEEAATAEEKSSTEEKEADTEASTAEAEAIKADKAETTDTPAEDTTTEAADEGTEKEGETTLSPFRKLFSGGLFSNLRKKASVKKTKEEEDKEAAVEEETSKTEDAAAAVEKEEKDEVKQETKEEAPATPEEVKSESTPEPEVTVETSSAATTDDTQPEEEKADPSAEEEKAPAEVTTEAELLSSQEKVKPQGSPLKKLFTGAGLKKLSTKKQKAKKDTETKLTEAGEQTAEQLQSSTESAENPKADSGPSSPEELEEHVIAVEVTQNESSQETDGEVTSDGEKKKEGIIAWSSFKKLVTPKKRVKRSSESEDEATSEKPAKSATLSSSESAPLADKSVEEEAKEEKPTEEEPKTENTEKLVSSTEEPKKKMDTSVSWEALMCMGGPKKRTRRTSDSDDEETKVEEESAAAALEGEQVGKTEAAIVSSQNTDSDGELVSSSEPLSPHPERESTWDTLKRIVMSKNKAKVEEKPEETTEQVQSDSEAPKDESSFSLRKLFPGRRKKKSEKQASTEQSEEDSDTPAVVPLSEYEDQVEAEPEAPAEPAEPAEIQIKVSTEDRSPSWIPAIVEDGDDKHDQLSDIPEEAENAATPKSIDTDIAEDETEDKDILSLEVPKRTGRRLSTAEVKPVALAPSAETTPVPQGPKPENAQEVMESIKAEISEIPPQMNVTVEDVPVEVVSDETEYEPPTENAESTTCTILEPHARDEAMAICTGLGTKEIAKVALEKPVMPIVEPVAVIRDGLITEMSLEEKSISTEEAIVKENTIINVEVHQVETTELGSIVESLPSNMTAIQAASENHESEIEKIIIVSAVQTESEIIQHTTMSENSIMRVDPVTPTSETAVCIQSVEVTEPSVEIKEVKIDVEQLTATEENTEEEVLQHVTTEIASTMCESTKSTITKETEPTIPVVTPSDMVCVSETVVIVEPISVAASDKVAMENTSEAENESILAQETKEEDEVEETVDATTTQTATSEISAVTEQSSEDMKDIKVDIQQASEIEAQSIVIAQAVIQDAMDKVSEDEPESEKPTIPTPVQAAATIEEEHEITPVIADTPVAIVCEEQASKSPQLLHVAMEVIDPTTVEVTESLDASVEENKSMDGLQKAVEVKVSEDIVVEEVEEIKAESQTGEEFEQVKEEQSKEDAEIQESGVKEVTEEVEPQSEESKSEAPSEQNKEEVLEIHMPVQVVLQTAQAFEEPSVEEEAAEEFDCNGSVAEDIGVKAKRAATESKLSTLSEEPQATASAEVSAPSHVTEEETPETPSGKCAEVMAQVIEVIEEAVKEIEPVSTEITAAS